MRRILILFSLIAAIVVWAEVCEARRVRTTRQHVKVRPDSTVVADSTLTTDSVTTSGFVRISGYEKTLRSRTESFYAANLSADSTITSLTVDIEYRDIAGRQLHRRRVAISVDLPPGQRRLLTFPSWDKQFVMYYRLSAPVRSKAQATAYDVVIIPVSAKIK